MIRILEEVAQGHYSDRVMEYTKDEYPETIRRIAEAMGLMMIQVEAREIRLQSLVQQLKEANEMLRRNIVQTVQAIAEALGTRDRYTQGHAERVGELAGRVARRLGLPAEEVEWIRIAGICHDIGKIGFSDRLFANTENACGPDLRREIQEHPAHGENILHHLSFLGPTIHYVLHHHERLDGTGYPSGLRGEAVPLGAQVIAAADSYDAMTTDRPYQKGRTPKEACRILRRASGVHFRPEVIDALLLELGFLPEEFPGESQPGQATASE